MRVSHVETEAAEETEKDKRIRELREKYNDLVKSNLEKKASMQ